MVRALALGGITFLLFAAGAAADPLAPQSPRTWPQAYTVDRNEEAGILTLRTPYYVIEQDLKRGGVLARIALTHGEAANLLVQPLEIRVRDDDGAVLSDVWDSAPSVAHRREGLSEIVTVECVLRDEKGRDSGLRVKSTLQYRWGYIKIRRELLAPEGIRVREVCPLAVTVVPSIREYGYREGRTEEEGAGAFSFGANLWHKLRTDQPTDEALRTKHVPRSMILANPGVEGLEWFVGSDLAQWDLQLAPHRGQGQCLLQSSLDPAGWALSVSPLLSEDVGVQLPRRSVFDFYVAVPILDGRAHRPWLHASFNRNRGDWVPPEKVRQWAEKGIQTVHCHNDGDYYSDGLFWRDGSYPPYPDMDRFDQVLREFRQAGIRTATYFSNKELHSSTHEFQEHGSDWGRQNLPGELRHNYYRPNSEFGVQMCLRSPWLDCLKNSIDRVLRNHPLDGVYYDWNVALYCCNPRHEGKLEADVRAQGHWDVDELLELMEWTRNRVGADGLVIIHNTGVPMYATENFADYVVATEWGYRKWTDRAPDLQDLPLEWSLSGALPRGVISYGVLDSSSPRRLHRLFALEAFLGGVTPWPVSEETFSLLPLLPPPGEIESYRFVDWRNQAVTLSDARCASAVYSRTGEARVLLANLDANTREVTCVLHREKLPHPLTQPTTAIRLSTTDALSGTGAQPETPSLDVQRLMGEGLPITIPGDGAIVIQVR